VTNLVTYAIVSPMGVRRWEAEDEAHAREQHEDAFGTDDPDERILSISVDHEERGTDDR
jgi:hypothetical protein